MSPTSYRTAPPRDKKSIISYDRRNVKDYYRTFPGLPARYGLGRLDTFLLILTVVCKEAVFAR